MPKSIDEIVVTGNLAELTDEQRTVHYLQVCDALGLDHRLHPLEYIFVDNNGRGQLILYVLRAGTDQLRELHGIDIIPPLVKEIVDGVCTFTAKARNKKGRTDISTGSVSVQGKYGQARADAVMAAETKAKRRVTLSLAGVGLLDETEIADMNSKVTTVAPGVGVTAPPNFTTPTVSQQPGSEVKDPPPHSDAPTRDPRIDLYKLQILQDGGIQNVPGMSIGAKWAKFILGQTNKKLLKDIPMLEWKVILDKLDEIRAKMGDKGVVYHIEETIKEKS